MEHPLKESPLVPRGQGVHEDDPQLDTELVGHISQIELEPFENVPFGHFIAYDNSQK